MRARAGFLALALTAAAWLQGASVAQADVGGRMSVTYRSAGNAQAAVVEPSTGTIVFDSASVAAQDPAIPTLGTYVWDLAADGSAALLHRMTIMNMAGELVVLDLESGDERIVTPPAAAQLIASTARLDATGDRVVYQYRTDDAPDQRNLMLGLWQNGTSQPLAGDPATGIVAFAVAPSGSLAFLAVPLGQEDAAPAMYTGDIDGGSFTQVAALDTGAPLALNPASTSVTLAADGGRAAISVPQVGEPTEPIRTHNFGVDLQNGDVFVHGTVDGSASKASISPDGSTVVLYDSNGSRLIAADFSDPNSVRALGPVLSGGLDRPVAWSPDGSHIAFGELAEVGGYQATVFPVAGGTARPVTSFEEGIWNAAFVWRE